MSKSKELKNNQINQSNSKGGRRPGAGRKPGAVTVKTRTVANEAMKNGKVTPLEFLLSVMHTEPSDDMDDIQRSMLMSRRLDAAKAAAQYMHPKLSSITSDNTHKGQLVLVSDFPS